MRWGTASSLRRGRVVAVALAMTSLITACGGAVAPTATPLPATPAPTATPDAHLPVPALGRDVYAHLNQAGLSLVGTNATTGTDPRATYNATYAGWPLTLLEYSGATARAKALPFRDGGAPGRSQPAFTFAGGNIAVLWGPIIEGKVPTQPDATRMEAARSLAAALDALIGPLVERSAGRASAVAPSPAP